MGFLSEGKDKGSTFYFELPVYGAHPLTRDLENAEGVNLIQHSTHETSTPKSLATPKSKSVRVYSKIDGDSSLPLEEKTKPSGRLIVIIT